MPKTWPKLPNSALNQLIILPGTIYITGYTYPTELPEIPNMTKYSGLPGYRFLFTI